MGNATTGRLVCIKFKVKFYSLSSRHICLNYTIFMAWYTIVFFAHSFVDQQFGLCSAGWFLSDRAWGSLRQLQSSGIKAGAGWSRMASFTYLGLVLAVGGASLSIWSLVLMEASPGFFTRQSQGSKSMRTLTKFTSTVFYQIKVQIQGDGKIVSISCWEEI